MSDPGQVEYTNTILERQILVFGMKFQNELFSQALFSNERDTYFDLKQSYKI